MVSLQSRTTFAILGPSGEIDWLSQILKWHLSDQLFIHGLIYDPGTPLNITEYALFTRVGCHQGPMIEVSKLVLVDSLHGIYHLLRALRSSPCEAYKLRRAHLRKCKKYEVVLCTRILFAPSLLDDRDHTRRLSACRRSAVGLLDGFNSTNRAC